MRDDFDDQLDWIKSHVDMRQVLEMCGIDPPDRQHKIRSIYNPKERTPSMHVYAEHYYCYATGRGGDQVQFVRDYKGMRMREAVEFLTGGGDPLSRRIELDIPTELPDFTEIFRGAREDTTETTMKLFVALIERKWPTLSPEDIFGFGSKLVDQQLWTPHWHHTDKGWVVRGIKTRRLFTGVKRAVTGSTFKEGLYVCASRVREGRAVLVEGESDTWCLTKAAPRVDVFGLPSGAGTWRDVWRNELLGYDEIGIALDTVSSKGEPDKAGIEAIDRVAGSIKSAGGCVTILDVPGGRVAEAVAQGWNIEDQS